MIFFRKKTLLFAALTTLVFIYPFNNQKLFAQSRLEIGPAVGLSFYQGDVLGSNVSEISKNISLAGGIHAGYYFNDYIGINLEVQRGKAKGGDNFAENPERRKRNLSFESPVTDICARFDWQITGYNPMQDRNFSLYGFAGGGVMFFNPKAEYKGKIYELQPLGTEGQGLKKYPDRKPYSLVSPTLDFGGGLKFAVNQKVNVAVEFSVYRTFTDYLDDVAGNYVPYTDILEEKGDWIAAALSNRVGELKGSDQIELAPAGSSRGNQKVFDYFYLSCIKVTYNFYDPFDGKNAKRFSKHKSTRDCFKF